MRGLTRKLVGVALTAILATMVTANVMAKDGNWSGTGTDSNPFLIEDEADLEVLSSNVKNSVSDYSGKYFKVSKDITITADTWVPIGKNTAKFSGTFDGDGKTISGINTDLTRYSGLFGYNQGTIKNVNVSGTANGKYYVALLTGYNAGTLENVSANGTVTGTSYVAGITGYNAGTIKNASAEGTVEAKNGYVSGIVGYNKSAKIENCYNNATITGSGGIGGIAGTSVSSSTITNCYNCGSINTGENVDERDNTHNGIGGIVGYNYDISNVYNCTNTGNISSIVDYTGGVIGYGYNSIIDGCNNTGTVSSTAESSAAIVGEGLLCKVRKCYYAKGTAEAGLNGENDSYEAYEALLAVSVGVDQHIENLATGYYVSTNDAGSNLNLKWVVISPKEMKTKVYEYSDVSENGKFGIIVNNLTSEDSVALCKVTTAA